MLVKPVLSIVDGVAGMEGNGPRNGRPIQAGLLRCQSFCRGHRDGGNDGIQTEELPVNVAEPELAD